MKLKGLHFVDVPEIQEAVTEELKKVQKRGIFGSFSETVRLRKSLYICQWGLILSARKVCGFDFFKKKNSLKTFGPHCVCL